MENQTEKLLDGEMHTSETAFIKYRDMIHYVCQRFRYRAQIHRIDPEDLFGESCVAFVRAYNKFDPDRGYRFSSYLIPSVEGQLKRYIRDTNPGLKYSRIVKEISWNITRYNLSGSTPSEIAEKLEVKEEFVKHALSYQLYSRPISIQQAIKTNGQDGEEVLIESLIFTIDDETQHVVNDFIHSLSPSDHFILIERLKDRTQKEIAQLAGVSQVQVSRILKKIGEDYFLFKQGYKTRHQSDQERQKQTTP